MSTDKRYHFPDTDPNTHTMLANVYYFRWPDYSSWAIFTVCDTTGEFSIQSDWGGFFYRWNIDSLGGGRSLTEFLAEMNDPYYVMNKLCYDRPDLKDEFDEEATRLEWQKLLHERMDGANFDISDKEKIEGQMEVFFDTVDQYGTAGVDIALYEMGPELYEFLYEEPWEYISKRPPGKVVICRDELLPRFFQYLRDHVVQPKPKVA
jgi:hypothetical protein